MPRHAARTTLDDPSAGLPSATNGTFATGINAAGQVVGSYNDASNTAHGFIYAAAVTVAARRTASMLPASISMFRSSNF